MVSNILDLILKFRQFQSKDLKDYICLKIKDLAKICDFSASHSHYARRTESPPLNYCERSRPKRGELAELASLRKARELMYRYMGKQNNWISRKLMVFERWSIKGKLVYFYPRTHFRHEPTRPDHDAL